MYPPSSTAKATASLENSSMWSKLNSSDISIRLLREKKKTVEARSKIRPKEKLTRLSNECSCLSSQKCSLKTKRSDRKTLEWSMLQKLTYRECTGIPSLPPRGARIKRLGNYLNKSKKRLFTGHCKRIHTWSRQMECLDTYPPARCWTWLEPDPQSPWLCLWNQQYRGCSTSWKMNIPASSLVPRLTQAVISNWDIAITLISFEA